VTSPGPSPGTEGRADIQAVDRVGQILALFTDSTTCLTTHSVAGTLGLNRTTAHRYLTSMVAEDLLAVSTRPPGYRLGSLALRLGGLTVGHDRVGAIAAEHMSRLADELVATITLNLWTATGPVVVRVQEPQRRNVRLTFRVGTILPIDTAQAAVFLAFGRNDEEREQSIRGLPEPGRSIIRAKAAEARRTGLATAVDETNGICCLAAPVFDGTGVRAVLAVVDTISSMPDSVFPHRLARLQNAAQDLTARLGGARPAPRTVPRDARR
jgi:DNA-binding IclR family transcriptional regulator